MPNARPVPSVARRSSTCVRAGGAAAQAGVGHEQAAAPALSALLAALPALKAAALRPPSIAAPRRLPRRSCSHQSPAAVARLPLPAVSPSPPIPPNCFAACAVQLSGLQLPVRWTCCDATPPLNPADRACRRRVAHQGKGGVRRQQGGHGSRGRNLGLLLLLGAAHHGHCGGTGGERRRRDTFSHACWEQPGSACAWPWRWGR